MARKDGERQTALVTGASTGIGADLAECFARNGYDVILTARSQTALNDVAAKARGLARTTLVRAKMKGRSVWRRAILESS